MSEPIVLQYTVKRIESRDERMGEYLDFIVEHGDGRIAFDSLHYWLDFLRGHIAVSMGIVAVCRADAELIGVSLVGHEFGDSIGEHSITVVHRAWRNNSIGAELLRLKCEAATDDGVFVSATVALANAASMQMCKRVMGEPFRAEPRLKHVEFGSSHFFTKRRHQRA